METRKVNLFVFDTPENFNKTKQFLGEEGTIFKRVICVGNLAEFQNQLNLLNDDDYVALAVHVFYTNKISGIRTFVASGIHKAYSHLQIMYISEGDSNQIKHAMLDAEIQPSEIYKYHQVQTNIEEDKITVFTKKELFSLSKSKDSVQSSTNNNHLYPQIDYAVITALYQDEFEQLKRIFNFPEDKEIRTSTKTYYRGYLKSDSNIEIVAAIPNASGMVDSSIIATQMLEFFKPKYLLMSGVCGGSKDLNFGDIIVAKQIFTFQKGKLSDLKKKGQDNTLIKVDLFDSNKNRVDYDHLYDEEGNKVAISIEKFEIEHDAIINLNTRVEDALNHKLEIIESGINRQIDNENFFSFKKEISVSIQPIACSTMVINKAGFFEDTIKSINRKTAAVEMESYGVARACHFANEGKTIPIIFKSVMDHTSNKSDAVDGVNYKRFAAYTSALFMKYLFEEKII